MGIAVGLGLAEFPFSGADPYWRWVAMCEEGGVDSLWQTDRLISGEPFLESMAAMAALAGATRRLKFGMNVVSAGLRDPILLAKQCATIDLLSKGRLLPAFGVGSPRGPEWAVLGRDPKAAGRIADEALEIVARLWREEKVDFEGKHFRLEGARISPRPVNPRIPFWIGGNSPAAIRRTARVGTGWQAGSETPEECRDIIARIRTAAAEAGRAIPEDHYGAAFPFRFGGWDDPPVARRAEGYAKRLGRDPKQAFIVGGAPEILARIREYVDAGVSKFVLRPLAGDDEDMLAQTRRLIDEVLPAVGRM